MFDTHRRNYRSIRWFEIGNCSVLRRVNLKMNELNTDFAYDSVPYDQVKTALSESQAEAEE